MRDMWAGRKRHDLAGEPPPGAAEAGATIERRLLVACLGPADGHEDAIASLAGESVDWASFVALARRNRVMPAVDHALRPLATAGALPDWFVGELRVNRAQNLASAKLLSLGVVRVSGLLADAGIRALFFKGPMLALGLYGSVGARQFNDLDVFVDPADARNVREALLPAGFELREDFEWTQSYSDPDSRIHVDLHQRLMPPEFRCELTFPRAWAQRVDLEIEGDRVSTFGPEHRFISAALQVAKDGWENRLVLQKVLDVAVAARAATTDDFDALAREAKKLRYLRVVANALETARSLDLGPAETRIDPRLLPTQRVRDHADATMTRLWTEDIEYPKPVTMAKRHRILREHPTDGLSPFVARAFAAPTEIDEARFRLPVPLKPLYRVLRPLRLVAAHMVRGVRVPWGGKGF